MLTTVEVRPSGAKILRHAPGEQPLLIAQPRPQEFCWLSTMDQVLLLRRHWNQNTESTEPCLCNPTCGSSRVDRLVAVALRMSHDQFDERLLVLPEEGWRCFERLWLLQPVPQPDTLGAMCVIQRTGTRRNGRTTCVPSSWAANPPGPFDVVAAARRQLHIAADFFGDRGDVEGLIDAGKAEAAALRAAKPRVPLGRRGG